METEQHKQLILEQFTRQAVPFAEMPAHSGEETNRMVIEMAEIGSADTVLDVACGPGLIACDAASIARHVTGIDLTPAMIEQAKKRQQAQSLTNMDWRLGDASQLPFPDATFSKVVTRYSFHHFVDPRTVLTEMVRVCRPGGRVTVVDVFSSSPEQGRAYDTVEKLRDPSHVRALGLVELQSLAIETGLEQICTAFYRLEVELDALLKSSFPEPGAIETIRTMFRDDLHVNRLGVGAELRSGQIYFSFPIVIVAGTRSLNS
jgi:ubiquinone/menaquinone biosynthesis C-methylase UbiE